MRVLRSLFACVLTATLFLGCSGEPETHELTLWITRWDYSTEADVRTAIENANAAGFDRVLFQVRGNATTFYPSEIEPWAVELGGEDPGFDPLGVALECAHRNRIELHAWVNVLPAWWERDLPTPEYKHLYTERPEWFWYDQRGNRQEPSERFYVSLNPCLPEVRTYLLSVFDELLTRYPRLDGLHLDYIRFPNEPPATKAGQDFPRDPKTLALFRAENGTTPDESPEAWDRWRAEAITEIVRDVRQLVRQKAKFVELSAAVGPEPELAMHHFQDYLTWIDEGLVDRLYPMNYTTDPERFASRIEAWAELATRVDVSMGTRLDHGEFEVRRQQLELALDTFGRATCFAYSSLFDSPNTEIDAQDDSAREARARRRESWLPVLTEWSTTPLPVVDDSGQ